MTINVRFPLAALLLAVLVPPAFAQEAAEVVADAGEAQTAPAEALDPVLRWQEDPTLVFDAADVELDAFRWIARPVVVFGESPFDPQFQQQMDLLGARPEALAERDVVLIVDTDPAAETEVRQRLRPRAFMLALIGKDGQIELRKPAPWDVRELSRSIDKMPLRQQEMRDRRGTDG